MTDHQVSYVLNTFRRIYKTDGLDICYGIGRDCKLQIKNCSNDFFKTRDHVNPEKILWKKWKDVNLPFLFWEKDDEIIENTENGVVINFDIVASSFYFLSGWQEFVSEKRDAIGRFPYAESIQHKLGIINVPVVNYYFDILKTALEKAYHTKLHSFNWNGYDFAVCSTHDIDKCQSAWKEGSFSELKKGNIISPFKLFYKRFLKNDDWFNFDDILEIEKKYGVHSTFYFLPISKKRNNLVNADYNVNDKRFSGVFSKIVSSGSEVAVHGSSGTHDHLKNFTGDIHALNADVNGNRFHFLLYDVCKTPAVLEQSGIKYDSTLYFAEHIGFRNSFCHPFFIYDLVNDQPTSVLEVPLNLMDGTLAMTKYMNVSLEKAKDKVFEQISEIKKFNGCFTLLWHNTHFSDYKYKGWRRIFIEIMEHSKSENASFVSCSEVYKLMSGHGS